MKIRRFNENIENNFITMEEVKDIISQLYDDNVKISIEEKWISFGTEAHVSNEKENAKDVRAILVGISFMPKDSVPFYCDYGVDSDSIKMDDLSSVIEILKEVVDISNQLKGMGYDVHTEIISYYIQLSITKEGTLKPTSY